MRTVKQIHSDDILGDGIWAVMNTNKRDVHEALLGQDMLQLDRMLANPISHNLFYGFDNLVKGNNAYTPVKRSLDKNSNYQNVIYSYCLRLGEAWGCVRLEYPESYLSGHRPLPQNPGEIIDTLEERYGTRFDFPNPYPGEIGLRIVRDSSGKEEVASYRAIQAIHQALLIHEKVGGNTQSRILEIGAGLGRTAYYARMLGYTNYTIIDLPITGVAQAHYLATVLGDDKVTLYGESERIDTVRMLPPKSFLEDDLGRFDIIVNVDSLPEMDFSTMRAYWDRIKTKTDRFLSINHEFRPHTVRELVRNDTAVKTYSRGEYWLRRGYVEEYMKF